MTVAKDKIAPLSDGSEGGTAPSLSDASPDSQGAMTSLPFGSVLSTVDGYERIVGTDAIFTKLVSLVERARFRVDSIVPSVPIPADILRSEPYDRKAIASGIEGRTIIPEGSRADSSLYPYIETAVANGSQVRTSNVNAGRLLIVDNEVALISEDSVGLGGVPVAAITRVEGIVNALSIMFEKIWEQSTPFFVTPSDSVEALSAQSLAVLRGVIAGHTDIRISRDTGLSPRTVSREIGNLRRRFGADSRAELSSKAVRQGVSEEE